MTQSFPPDVLVLDDEQLLHARLARGKKGPRIVQAKSYRLLANTFSSGVVTPQLTNEPSLAEAVRRMRMETGRWDSASVLLPDSWFRINILEIANLPEASKEAEEMVRATRLGPLLTGFRGSTPDLGALCRMASSFSRIMVDNPSIAEMEVNPVVVGEKGAWAVDARATVVHTPRAGRK